MCNTIYCLPCFRDIDSSSDEEMVERCNWRQTRQKLKEDLSTHGAAATLTNTDREKQKTDVFPKLEYKKPPRVINLQVQNTK